MSALNQLKNASAAFYANNGGKRGESLIPMHKLVARGVNWNRVEDSKDLEVWNRLTTNFWLPERIALSNDKPSWKLLTEDQKTVTKKVFGGLTVLDTAQSMVGAPAIMQYSRTDHEAAVMGNIIFMEAVHAKSYSSIFSTLCSTEEIDEIFLWAENNEHLQKKANLIINEYQAHENPMKCRIASVLLESFLFYTGFFWPLWLSSRQKLPNSADIIRLIIRDEAVHGFYIGYKFQQNFANLSIEEQDELRNFTFSLLYELYEVMCLYTAEIYDSVGLTEEVKRFLHYNANKALHNLGFDPMFPEELCDVSPAILSAINPSGDENHDFFSGGGNSYVIGRYEPTANEDWDLVPD